MRRPAVFVFMFRLLTLLLPFALLAADPSRVNLNLGSGSNDGTGDGLRTAFTKINTNVINLWSQVFTNNAALIAGKLDATNGTAVALSGSLTNATANGIALTVAGISAVAATTAGDLQDLASNGILQSTAPARIRVLRDNDGRVLGSGRWYSKNLTDTRTSDGVTIVLPIDIPSDATAGRWVLEGYEP
jgi:hypothetical protein